MKIQGVARLLVLGMVIPIILSNLLGCVAKVVTLRAEVEGAEIFVDEQMEGSTSAKYTLLDDQIHRARAAKPGYYGAEVAIDKNHAGKEVKLPCTQMVLSIITAMKGGKILIDGKEVGSDRFVYKLDDNNEHTVDLEASGYLPRGRQTLSVNSPIFNEWKRGTTTEAVLTLVGDEDELYKSTVATDQANKWVQISVVKELDKAGSWQKLVSIVNNYFDVIETLEPQSGYLKTAWKISKYNIGNKKYEQWVRTQLVVNIVSTEPLSYRVKLRSEATQCPVSKLSDPNAVIRDEDYAECGRILRTYENVVEELKGKLEH